MSPRLPSLSPREVIRALERGGFLLQRVHGSHYILKHEEDSSLKVVVPRSWSLTTYGNCREEP